MTENKNRTAAEVRHLLGKLGGNLGESGSVAWMFDKKGYLTFPKEKTDEEKLMTVALDAGAEDIRSGDPENYEVLTSPADFEHIKESCCCDLRSKKRFHFNTCFPNGCNGRCDRDI